MTKFDQINSNQIDNIIKDLPPRQQEAVRACISAAKAKKPCGRRYTQQWIYECALMRIKSCALYRKMIRDQTLALPSLRQLQRYMRRLKPAYGFLDATFELLKKKSAEMEESECHGKSHQIIKADVRIVSYLSWLNNFLHCRLPSL